MPILREQQNQIPDKLPMMYVKCAEDMPRFFEEQLQKCQVEYFDYYMLHDLNTTNYDSKVVPFKAFEFISKLKEEGNIEKALESVDSLIVYDKIKVTAPQAKRFSNGGGLDCGRFGGKKEPGLYNVYDPEGEYLGVGEIDENKFFL